MKKAPSAQALRYSVFVRPFTRDDGPATFRAYKRTMLAKAQSGSQRLSKLKQIELAVSRPEGASMSELMMLTGWQPHSVRGAISAALRKNKGLVVQSERDRGHTRYRCSR